MPKNIRRILITQNTLVNYAGSEVITLEMCRYWTQDLGYEVTIYTNYVRNPFKKEFDKLQVTIITDINDPVLAANNFDLIWVHHQLFPPGLLQSVLHSKRRPYIVFHHMSPYEPFEEPLLKSTEYQLADMILANSDETHDHLSLFFKNDKISVFGNPFPPEFLAGKSRPKPRKKLSKILVVSNHVPPELAEALDRAERDSAITVTYIGYESKQKLVTPSTLRPHDLVVTIGKTVQYCLAMNIPVYCYDRFGGPGYLSQKNFSTAAWYNFSGRGFDDNKKDFTKIHDEIINDFPEAKLEFYQLHAKYSDTYSLAVRFNKVIDTLQSIKKSKISLNPSEVSHANKLSLLLSREVKARYSDHDYLSTILKKDRRYYKKRIADHEREDAEKRQQIYQDQLKIQEQDSIINEYKRLLHLTEYKVAKRLHALRKNINL